MSGLQHRRTTHDLFAPKGAQPYGAAASASAPPPTAPPPAPVAARAIQPKTVGQPYVEAEVVRESALYEYFWLWCCGIFFVLVFFGFFFWLGVEAAENNHGFCNGNNHGSHDGHGDMCHCESFGGHQHCGLVAEFVASRMNLKKKVRDSGWFESSLWQEDIYLHQPKLQLASVNHYVDQIAHDTSLINAPEGVTVERVSAEYRPLFRRAAMAAFDKIGVHNATGATVHTVHTWVYQKSQKWRVLASVAPEATQNWISFTVMREKGGAFVLDNVDTSKGSNVRGFIC